MGGKKDTWRMQGIAVFCLLSMKGELGEEGENQSQPRVGWQVTLVVSMYGSRGARDELKIRMKIKEESEERS